MKRASLGLAAAVALGGILATPPHASAQERLSPPDSSEVEIAGRQLKVIYGSPTMRGRVIFGGLVPFNRVWRTGANEATTFITEANLRIGGAEVPAGEYTLFTIPDQDEWTLIVNRQTRQWGTEYHEDMDLVRVDMEVEQLEEPIESFRILFEQTESTEGALVVEWATTRATVRVEVLR